jgi:ABC-type sugar transport system ATPase subunit
MSAYLQFKGITKLFPGVKALNRVSFAADAGSVHGLLGENGAGKSTLLKARAAMEFVRTRLQAMGVSLNPTVRLARLSIAQRQMVEICKALLRDAKIIALDEPTSSLSHRETQILFRLVKDLQAQGKVLIYVSHRLEEIFELCDACTILRDGQGAGGRTYPKTSISAAGAVTCDGEFS